VESYFILGLKNPEDLKTFATDFQSRGVEISCNGVIFLHHWQVSEGEIQDWLKRHQRDQAFWLKMDETQLWAKQAFYSTEMADFQFVTPSELAELCARYFELKPTDLLATILPDSYSAKQSLPSFLSATSWAGLLEAAETNQEIPSRQVTSEFEQIQELTKDCPLSALSPPLQLSRQIMPVALFLLAWMVSDQSSPGLKLTFPTPQAPPAWPEAAAAAQLWAEADSWILNIQDKGTPFGTFNDLWDAWFVLEPFIAEATHFELKLAPLSVSFDEAERPDPGAIQIYQGSFENGLCTLTRTYPALPSARLASALELGSWVINGAELSFSLFAKSTLEEELRLENLDNMTKCEWSDTGLIIQDLPDRAFLARRLFRRSFGDCFNLRQSLALAEKMTQDWAIIADLSQQLFRSPALSVSAEVLYAGQSGRFFRADLSQLNPSQTNLLKDYHQFFAELGFFDLGDLIWEPASDIVLSVLVNPQIQTYGACLLTLRGIETECISCFENQAWLTTTSLAEVPSFPEWGLFRSALPEVTLTERVQTHQQNCQTFANEYKTGLRSLAQTLEDFLPEIDQVMSLSLKAMKSQAKS
jgi:hypothetical protein